MQQRNKQLVVCAGAFLAFVYAVPVKWYTLKGAMTGVEAWPFALGVIGLSGSISLLFDAPDRLLLAVSAFIMVVSAMNIFKLTSIPQLVLAVKLGWPGIHCMSPFVTRNSRFVTAARPVLAILVHANVPASRTRPVVFAAAKTSA